VDLDQGVSRMDLTGAALPVTDWGVTVFEATPVLAPFEGVWLKLACGRALNYRTSVTLPPWNSIVMFGYL
jgi:hypothetical protein